MRPLSPVLLALTLLLSACGGPGEPAARTPAPDRTPAPPAPAPEPPPPAPWSRLALSQDEVAPVLLEQWRAADNRLSCALLAFRDPAPAGRPRAAQFGGGWGIAWDLPEQRSAYGVAGTGTTPGPNTYDDWPNRITWADGSEAGWGPEGGSGPNQLAYVEVAGESCLYNVWSRLGEEHLEELLGKLRFVAGAGR